MWNLLINAIKFTPSGGSVTVAARRVGSKMRITIEDTGAGIASHHLAAIFQRFKQIDGSTIRAHGGLGLGLAIVRHLVEGHGGTVSAESPGNGQGSTFIVILPIHAVASTEAAQQSGPLDVRAVQAPNEGALVEVNILIVDNERDSRDLLRIVLEGAGATVTEASSVDPALDLVSEGQFDVVISDIGMPGRDGYSFMRELRTRHSVPAIALTAYARTEDAQQARHAGFREHATKPVDASKLIETTASLVSP